MENVEELAKIIADQREEKKCVAQFYAPNIRILSPQSLVEEHAGSLQEVLGRYE